MIIPALLQLFLVAFFHGNFAHDRLPFLGGWLHRFWESWSSVSSIANIILVVLRDYCGIIAGLLWGIVAAISQVCDREDRFPHVPCDAVGQKSVWLLLDQFQYSLELFCTLYDSGPFGPILSFQCSVAPNKT